MDIQTLVTQFTTQLSSLIEGQTIERARAAFEGAFRGRKDVRRGRPPQTVTLTLSGIARKKPPRQLCPVPGCKNPAAPVFGMVCTKHKDVAKAKIKQYREARRAKKLKAK